MKKNMTEGSGSGSGLEKITDPDPVKIRPDPKPWAGYQSVYNILFTLDSTTNQVRHHVVDSLN